MSKAGVSYKIIRAEYLKDAEFKKEYDALKWEFRIKTLSAKLKAKIHFSKQK